MKNIIFFSENFQFLVVNFSIYLNRRVFLMMAATLVMVLKALDILNFLSFSPILIKVI